MENLETEQQFNLELLEEQKIRAELNVEKWSFWQPSKSTKQIEEKSFEREIVLSNGKKTKAKVSVIPTTRGNLTTFDQKVFYALIKIWEEKGKEVEKPTYISIRYLAKVLKVGWGTKTIQILSNSMSRLRLTHFTWEHSYYDAENKKTLEVLENPFTLLSNIKLFKRTEEGITTKQVGYFKFDELILKNLKNNYTKPILFDVVISFKSEIAQIIYSKVDLFLTDNPRYERRTKELFEDLSLEGKSYKNKSKRKQMLIPALSELLGKPLSNGGMIGKANLELTKDGTDLKVVFERRQRVKNLLPKSDPYKKSESRNKEKIDLTDEEKGLLSQILEYGVSEAKALDILKRTKTALERQIMYYPYSTLSRSVNNPAGWILRAIEKDYLPPTSYKKEAEAKKAKIEFENRNREEQKKLQREETRFEAKEQKKELAKGKYLSFSKERQDELYKIYYDKVTKRDYKPEHLKLTFVQGLLTQQVLTEVYLDIAKGKII